ncbi:MAG: noncanonical pyrimidine nucleotidase, YjjG family [Clostridiales bacterium]|nr:noncanonical pyrimidine nucleotidase, YjjG family [Clostridiales bacterium]
MQRYSIVFLDMDQTLFDFHAAEHLALQQVLQRFNIDVTDENERLYKASNQAMWRQFDQGLITQQQVGVGRFAGLLAALHMDEALAAAMNDDYELTLGLYGILLPGAEELCRRLSEKCSLYILTNGMSRSQRGRLSRSDIQPYIRRMFVSQEMGCQKPMKEYFRQVFDTLELTEEQRKQVIMVGDSLTSDIQGGINAGLDTIWYHPKGNEPPKEQRPTWEAKSLEQIGNIILGEE